MNIIGEDCSDAVLYEQKWEGQSFVRCDFTEADMRGVVTSGCTFTECTFDRTDLGESSHTATAFRSCRFNRAVLASTEFTSCSWLGSMFVDCAMRPMTVKETDLTLVGLSGARLPKASLRGMRLRGQPGERRPATRTCATPT